jgi:hypothetical protein
MNPLPPVIRIFRSDQRTSWRVVSEFNLSYPVGRVDRIVLGSVGSSTRNIIGNAGLLVNSYSNRSRTFAGTQHVLND